MTASPEASPTPLERLDGVPVGTLATAWGVPSVEAWPVIGSTNDRALALARAGCSPWTVVVADRQTSGRGRRGAPWLSPATGVWMSIVLDGAGPIETLPLVVGVACAEGIESVSRASVTVKWPNDLLVGGRKLAGILAERAGDRVVVGIGINLDRPEGGFSGEIAGRAVALSECLASAGIEAEHLPGRIEVAGSVIGALRTRIESGAGLAGAMASLRRRDALRDQRVVSEQEGPGIARGIADDGALWLERPAGTRVRVVSGSVQLQGGPPCNSS